ncbi:MAG: type IV secretion protein IcmD [Coxiellaceae bacterium]|nr:type IV secretion protein IcmD [Coxiellaceae bacterium]
MRFWKIVGLVAAGIGLALIATDLLAAAGTPTVTVAKIQGNVKDTVTATAKILQDLSLIAGIGFIMASFFKFHQHKLNPTQVPMSQGVTLLVIGAGLTMFPILIPTAASTIAGSKTNISNVSGSGINSLITGK